MKTIIKNFKEIFRNLRIARYNRRNNVWLLSESEFKKLVDRTKPVITIA